MNDDESPDKYSRGRLIKRSHYQQYPKLYATLLRADQPLGRSELIDRAGISASSYDRRLSDVCELPRVHAVQVDGHRRWITDHKSATRPPADMTKTPTPLLAHRQTNPSHRVVSSHPDVWTHKRTAHAYTDLFTPISTQNTMTRDITLPVKTHRRQPPRDDHRDVPPAHHLIDSRMPDPHHHETLASSVTPTLHTNRKGETQ